jgi:hypothetical protein
MTATLEIFAPQPEIECWAQGSEPPLIELTGQVVLIEVIQVNCPGCFLHALPEVIRLHETYESQGLKTFVIATAFEHFEHNTLNNLQRLLQHGEVQGDPLSQLSKADFLIDNKLPYTIPFSVAMDKLVKNNIDASKEHIEQLIISQIPNFYQNDWHDNRRESIIQQAESYLKSKTYNALTFEMYKLQGTPSSILIDKEGLLKQVSFGAVNSLEPEIQQLLKA